jgi:two-component system copper resistance phosphate regulon response regulator CusR
MKILVIDDDPRSVASIRKGLRESGFVVDVAPDGHTGFQPAQATEYDLIVLEVMLPGRDGWSILEELRTAGNLTPALFLTTTGDLEDRVKGLELGADDFLVKPFALPELLARIRAILRRSPRRLPEPLKVGDLEIDLLTRRVSRAGRRVQLTAKEFALVSHLARRAGQPLSVARLAEMVWDMNYEVESNTVVVHMRRLRAKLDGPFEHKLVHTIRGVGYVMEVR